MKEKLTIPQGSETTIVCPNCQTEVALSEAMIHRFREQLQADFETKRKQQEKVFAQKEGELREKQQQIDQARQEFDARVQERVEIEKARLLASARQEAHEQLSLKLNDLQTQLDVNKRRLMEAETKELDLLRRQRDLQEKAEKLELEVERKISEERGRIRDEAKQQAVQEQTLKMAEKEKLIGDLQKQIDVLKQKAEQGSQQLQGEVLEMQLESTLKSQFPHDEIVPVPTGTRGADLLQKVRVPSGLECGTLIWELKRTRTWNSDWLAKLRNDQRANGAEIAILVTQALPREVKCFDCVEGVWITDVASSLSLAVALRQGLLLVAHERHAATGKNEKMEILYRYLSGVEFRQRVEALAEAFRDLKSDLETEKRAMAKIWAGREKQIAKAMESTARMFGDVQGIIGKTALPEIEVLQLEG